MDEKMTFEETLKKLEEASEKLRSQETSLEDAIKYYEDGSVRGYYTLTSTDGTDTSDGRIATEYNQDGSLRQSRDYENGMATVVYDYYSDGTYRAAPAQHTSSNSNEGSASSDSSTWTYGTYTVDSNGNVVRSDGVTVPGSSNFQTLCQAYPTQPQCS